MMPKLPANDPANERVILCEPSGCLRDVPYPRQVQREIDEDRAEKAPTPSQNTPVGTGLLKKLHFSFSIFQKRVQCLVIGTEEHCEQHADSDHGDLDRDSARDGRKKWIG